MTEQIVNKICNDFFQNPPTEIIRNNVGLAGYVYTVQIKNEKYVIKISDDKNLILGSTYWLNKLKDLEIPIPKVISENASTSLYYFIMTFIPGKDLGLVYSSLQKDEKKAIAKTLFNCQKEIKNLPMASGFGSLNSYEDTENLFTTWEEVVLNDIQRAEDGIKENKIFSTEYVAKLRALIPDFKTYFSTVKPEPFLDDATTKNVLVHEGRLSGIIDLDWITFGDQIYFLGLTTMALLSMQADLDYAEYLKEEMNLNPSQKKALQLYILIFCVIFMSEKGACFNQNEPVPVTEQEKKILIKIFEKYYTELKNDCAESTKLLPSQAKDVMMLTAFSKWAFETDVQVGASAVVGPPGYKSNQFYSQMNRAKYLYSFFANGIIIGGAVLIPGGNPKGTEVEIGRIFLNPEHFKKGYGIKLMQAAEALFPNAKSFILDTPIWNTRTNSFYKKLGYIEYKRNEEFVFYRKDR